LTEYFQKFDSTYPVDLFPIASRLIASDAAVRCKCTRYQLLWTPAPAGRFDCSQYL